MRMILMAAFLLSSICSFSNEQAITSPVPLNAVHNPDTVKKTNVVVDTNVPRYGQKDTIPLDSVAVWTIYDMYGNMVHGGESDYAVLAGLQAGAYYLIAHGESRMIYVYNEDHHRERKQEK